MPTVKGWSELLLDWRLPYCAMAWERKKIEMKIEMVVRFIVVIFYPKTVC